MAPTVPSVVRSCQVSGSDIWQIACITRAGDGSTIRVTSCVKLCRMDDPRDGRAPARVRDERWRRGWSIRRAAEEATAAGARTTNTTWGSFEAGDADPSGRMREAVAAAFGWPPDWP